MTQNARLKQIEKAIPTAQITNWIRADRDGDGPITLDGKPLSQAEIDELAAKGIGLIIINRVDAPLPKEATK